MIMHTKYCVALLLVVLVTYLPLSTATTPRDQAHLTSLPGLNPFPTNFDQYTGYITVNNTQNLFYWFVTSQNNPATDPVVLWMQGGPGCSGLGDGFLWEHGPFLTDVTSFSSRSVNLKHNFYSWNKVANIIYIESPLNVGFSYSEGHVQQGDNHTAALNYEFLQNFFELYPEFKSNELWLSGESYAGVYVPTLAHQIMFAGQSSLLKTNLQRGGITLGNPVTNCEGHFGGIRGLAYYNTQVNLFYWHALVSPRTFQKWLDAKCNTNSPPSRFTCEELYATIERQVGFLDQPPATKKLSNNGLSFTQPKQKRQQQRQPAGSTNPDCLYYSFCTGNTTMDFNTAMNEGCFAISDQISTYLNRADVQKAINARATKWEECASLLYSRNAGAIMPYLEALFSAAPNMRILYYSGDTDIATVPFAHTENCLDTLKRPIVNSWRPWVMNKEVAGYVEEYDTFTFATIKGAGHEAPGFQPSASYLLYSYFLANKTLPRR